MHSHSSPRDEWGTVFHAADHSFGQMAIARLESCGHSPGLRSAGKRLFERVEVAVCAADVNGIFCYDG